MNLIAYFFAVMICGLMFAFFKGLIEDCFQRADAQSSGPIGSKVDVAFNLFLALLFGSLFMALCMIVMFVCTQPSRVFHP